MSKQYEKDTKRFISISKSTVKCKCGHSILFPDRKDRQICSWCGYWCYKNPKVEFKYKLRNEVLK